MLRVGSPHLAWLVVAASLAGCSGGSDNPDLRDVARQYSESYCIKLEECLTHETFISAYPGGQEDCASRTMTISGTNEKSICPQEQWDKCMSDLEDSTCLISDAGESRPKIPDSCKGC